MYAKSCNCSCVILTKLQCKQCVFHSFYSFIFMIAFIVMLKALLNSIFIALTVFCSYWLFKYTLKLLNFFFTVFKTLKVNSFSCALYHNWREHERTPLPIYYGQLRFRKQYRAIAERYVRYAFEYSIESRSYCLTTRTGYVPKNQRTGYEIGWLRIVISLP